MGTPIAEALDDTKNRRDRLRQWIQEHHDGVQAKFIEAHKEQKLNQGLISGFLKSKSFGSVAARNLEKKVGMPPRYLEERPSPTPDKVSRFRDLNAFEAQFVTLFRQLSDDGQHDELVSLNQRVDRAAAAPSAQSPYLGKENRRGGERRESLITTSRRGTAWRRRSASSA